MKTLEYHMTYKDKEQLFKEEFDISFIPDFGKRLALISLLGYVMSTLRKTHPDASVYTVIKNMGSPLYDHEIQALAIVVENFTKGSESFPLFGVAPKEVVKTIKEILNTALPF